MASTNSQWAKPPVRCAHAALMARAVAGWALTTPLFPRAEVSSENGHRLTIDAGGAGSYIQAARLDGAPYRRAWLPLSALRRSSVLVFSLGRNPNRRWGI